MQTSGVLAAVLCLLTASGPARAADPLDVDLLLKGGTIHDGAGGEPARGDVGIKGDRIVAVGAFEVGRVGQTIDCEGLVVAPGFIDLHNHSDEQIVRPETRACVNYLTQGCTTIVTGNCGSGPVDAGAYYKSIDDAGAGPNVAHLLPQGSLRKEVMGLTARAPSADELERMKELTDEAMHDGAWGMSSGLIYVPSSYAETPELVELAGVVARHHGIYASHIRDEGPELLAAVDEALEIGRRAKLPVHVSHFKSSGEEAWGLVRRAADLIEEARRSGERVTADQYPYVASSTSLEATLIPTWARSGGEKELLARLDDPEQGPRIREAIAKSLRAKREGAAIRIARYELRQEWVGRDLAEIARREKSTPLEVALTITRGGGAAVVNFSMSEEDVRHVMQLPWVATASDGRAYLPGSDRPHPRSYGTFVRKLGHYAVREQVVDIAQAIRSSSGLPADILGLADRGYLKPGHFADVVAFDPQRLEDRATFDEPHQYAEGVRFVFVNGTPVVFDGAPMGALAGRALRHASAE